MDIKGVFKDNQKLLLSALGVLVMVILIATQGSLGSTDTEYFPGTSTSGGSASSDKDSSGSVEVINNGKNDDYSSAPAYQLKSGTDYKADIITNKGTFRIELYELDTPNTVNSFVFLAEEGFFNATSFHRIEQNFVIQGGDPLGNGYGGPGYAFADEIIASLRFEPYVVAMANSGSNTNGSQFFIPTRTSNTSSLAGSYTIFGRVISGFNVVDTISEVDVVTSGQYTNFPVDAVKIDTIRIIDN